MHRTLHAARPTHPSALRVVHAMSAGSVRTRHAPVRHCRDARVCGHTTKAMHDIECTTPLLSRPFGCAQVFLKYCRFGDRRNDGRMVEAKLTALCKDAGITDAKRFTAARVGISFAKLKSKVQNNIQNTLMSRFFPLFFRKYVFFQVINAEWQAQQSMIYIFSLVRRAS